MGGKAPVRGQRLWGAFFASMRRGLRLPFAIGEVIRGHGSILPAVNQRATNGSVPGQTVRAGTLVGGGTTDSQELLRRVVAYLTLFLGLGGLQGPHLYIREHLDMGTLEHAYLSPVRLRGLVAMRIITTFLRTLALILLSGVVLFRLFGLSSQPSWYLIPACVLIYLATSGAGFALGALTLRYKRTGAFINVVSLACLGVTLLPPQYLPQLLSSLLRNFLPFSFGAGVVMQLLSGMMPTSDSWGQLCLLAACYLLFGWTIFRKAEADARRDGHLSAG